MPLGDDRTVEQVLTRELRRSIIEGRLQPGVRLPYRDLAARFNVSVTPVRIALRELVTEGLVEFRPHGGARVAPLSREELEHLYATRIGYESLLALRGVAPLDAGALATLDELWQRLERSAGDSDVDTFLRASWEQRLTCYQAAGSPTLVQRAEELYARSGRYNELSLVTDERMRHSLESAAAFRKSCVRGDGRMAATSVRDALMRTLDYLLDAFPSDPSAAPR